ncbi:MAG: redoxin domain-containing protein, partial [Deltaproteobacteria bacterium]
ILREPQGQSIRLQLYHLMTENYLTALSHNSEPLPAVEDALIDFAVLCDGGGAEVAMACTRFAENDLRPAFVARCAAALRAASARGVPPDTEALLLGTLAANRKDAPKAVELLSRAALSRPLQHNAPLYLRIARMQAQAGDVQEAKRSCEALLRIHPLIGDGNALYQRLLGDANQADTALRNLAKLRRQDLLDRQTEVQLQHKTAMVQGSEVALNAAGQATVVVFFASWCPHCQSELPHIEALAQAVERDASLRKTVRIIGIKTAQQRENAQARAFWGSFKHSFPVYEDAEMSRAFTAFAKDCGRPTVLPTTAIVDATGVVRFFIEPGLYKDIGSEVLWAAQATLSPTPA